MATITAVNVLVVTPDGQEFTVNTTLAAAAEAGELSAVDQVVIAWGQSTPIDSQDAGRIELTLTSSTPNPAPYDSEVTITASVNGFPAILIAHGWVLTSRYAPRGDLWLTRLVLTDVLGRSEATKLPTDELWPAESVHDRLARIETAAGWSCLEDVYGPEPAAPVNVATSDTVKELAERTLRVLPAALVEGAEAMTSRKLAGALIQWPGWYVGTVPIHYDPLVVMDHGLTPVDIPGAAIGSLWRGDDRSSLITQIRYTTVSTETVGDRVDTTLQNPNAPVGATAELLVAADTYYDDDDAARYLELLAGLRRLVTLDPGPIMLNQVGVATLSLLIGIPQRAGVPLRIVDCPVDLDPFQTVVAGTLTIDKGLKAKLDVTLKPTAIAGARPLRFSDFPGPGDIPPTTSERGYVAATFGNAGQLTAAYSRSISNPRPDRY